mmetsp:Transcript_1543/g.5302  ORF Transcript_1543/g.5302 Transcript_1543/m.5302 type:complete len:270 (+) Transcript_1543:2024-2833(+)
MQVGHLFPGETFQLFNRINDDKFGVFLIGPHWNWSTPVPRSRDGPILGTLEPVVEALLLYKIRHPVSLFVVCKETLLQNLDAYEPRWDSTVNERGIRAPAEWIPMLEGTVFDDATCLFDGCNNVIVGVLDVLATEVGDWSNEASTFIQWARNLTVLGDDAIVHAHTVIIFSKSRCIVNDTGTRVAGNIGVSNHLEGSVLLEILKVVEERHVFLAHQISSLHGAQNFEILLLLLFVNERETPLCDNVVYATWLVVNLHIVKVWIHTESKI